MDNKQTTALICALQNGDKQAASSIYEIFYNDIYYFILKTIKDPELAADLTQDTFIEILESIGNLRIPSAFIPWSKKIAYHKCTAFLRKKRDLLADEKEDGYSLLDLRKEDRWEFIPDENIDHKELQKTISDMIDALPEEQRNAIILRYYDELSIKDIAKIQKASEGTIKSRLSYGRKTIKSSIEEYENKNHVQIHCIGVVPVLLWFFKQERQSNGISLSGMTPIAETFTTVITSSTKDISKKIIALLTATLLVTSGASVAINRDSKTNKENKAETHTENMFYLEDSESEISESLSDLPENSVFEDVEDEDILPDNSDLAEDIVTSPNSMNLNQNVNTVPNDTGINEAENPVQNNSESSLTKNLSFTLSDDGSYYILSDAKNYTYKHLSVPAEYKGLPVTTISEGCSLGSNITKLTLSKSISYIDENALNTDNIVQITVAEDNPVYHSAGNCVIDTAKKTLVLACRNSTIPSDGSVKIIGANAFRSNPFLTNINIPMGIEQILSYAFSGCSNLTDIFIPNSVNFISSDAFPNNVSITIAKDNPVYHSSGNCIVETDTKTLIRCFRNSIIPTDGSVTRIGSHSFNGFLNLEHIIIPDTVSYIETRAFSSCNDLLSVTISSSNLKIENNAFMGCKNLTDIYYSGTIAQWHSVTMNSNLTSITIHCSDGDISP